MANHLFYVLIISLAAMHATLAVDYTILNTAVNTGGGVLFRDQIGLDYSQQTMTSATNFIRRTFQQINPSDGKTIQGVTLYIENTDGVAYTVNNEIHFNANYLGNYKGDVKREFTGVLYHEMTHILQFNGNGKAPSGLIEGIADFVRLKANYVPSHWVKAGEGNKWDQGYDVTARFLDYCNGIRNGFVAELNKKLANGYSANYFDDLLGKSVDQLWSDYKTNYGN